MTAEVETPAPPEEPEDVTVPADDDTEEEEPADAPDVDEEEQTPKSDPVELYVPIERRT